MEATRVKIDPITIQKAERNLTRRERIKLKREKIVSYIKSQTGVPLRIEELGSVGGIKHGSAHIFIKAMLRDGVIQREQHGPRTFSYSVQDGEVKTIRAKTTKWSAPELEDVAMRFSWETPEKYNDLHAFIAWLKLQEV